VGVPDLPAGDLALRDPGDEWTGPRIIHIGAGSLLLPILIIASVYVPYVARPVRGIVFSLKEREFIQAAIASGASDWHILRKEILPNVAPSVIVFFR